MSRVLVIGDCHCPVMLPGYIEFLRSIYRQWKCNRVIHIGDVTDFHCVCYHEKNPEAPPPTVELAKAKLWVLDEPLTALDVQGVQLMESMILEHKQAGGSVIFTTHHGMQLDCEMRTLELGSFTRTGQRD